MNKLSNLSPLHHALVAPLERWKILKLDDIQQLSGVIEKTSNFYKKIKHLEAHGLIDGSIDPYTHSKYVYFTQKGIEDYGLPKNHIITCATINHDSLVSDILIQHQRSLVFNSALTEIDLMKDYPMMNHRPDGAFKGHHKKDFLMAVELEISMKSKNRVEEIFQFYSSSGFFNNVLYIFSSKTVYEKYQQVLIQLGSKVITSKFLFLYSPNLYRRQFDLVNSEVTWQGQKTNLKTIFSTVHSQGNERVIESTAF